MSASMRRVAVASTVGTMIEWYDFFLFNTAAALVLGRLFFPTQNPATGTLLAFATSATGFVARPLGAILAGHLGDRVGRKAMLLATLLSMGLATTLIGVLPTYASIGIAAPILLVILRLVQGMATGGEWAGAALMIVEHTRTRRSFWGSLIISGVALGLILSSLAFAALNGLSEAALLSWGWRIPFLFSAALVVVGLYIRLKVTESPEFATASLQGTLSKRPILDALSQPRNIGIIFVLRVAETFSFYIFSAFSLAYAVRTLGMPRSQALAALLIAAVVVAVVAPAVGALCDRVSPQRVLIFGVVFQALFAFPFFWLLQAHSFWVMLVAEIIAFSVCNAPISVPTPAYFADFFDVRVRFSGVSLGRETATIIGGGLSPLIASALLDWTGGTWPIAACMCVTSLLGLGALVVRPSPRNETIGRAPDLVAAHARPGAANATSLSGPF